MMMMTMIVASGARGRECHRTGSDPASWPDACRDCGGPGPFTLPPPPPAQGPAAMHRPAALALSSALALAALLAAPTAAVHADDPAATPAARALFDGKSLDGWQATMFRNAGEVSVVDGVIALAKSQGGRMTGITCTRPDLPRVDYELVYEARRLDGKDFFAAATFPVGSMYVTLVNGGWGGTVTGLSSIDGADASENTTTKYVEYTNGTWYKFRIRVTAQAIRVLVDEKLVIDVDITDRQLGTRVEVRPNQPLGFATWASAAEIRKVELRPLTAAEVAAQKPKDLP